MEDDKETIIRCRYNAEKNRVLAALTQDAKIRESLMDVAKSFEALAAAIEDLAKNKRMLVH